METRELTLETIGNGVVPELFALELNNVIMNIDDPNTDPSKVRKINISLTFAPSEDRATAAVKVAVKSSLVGVMETTSSVYLGQKNGVLGAFVSDPGQSEIDFDNVTTMTKEDEG
jgi:hypothetical protein